MIRILLRVPDLCIVSLQETQEIVDYIGYPIAEGPLKFIWKTVLCISES